MGAWGEGIEESDTVLDVIGAFVEHLRSTPCVASATAKVVKDFSHLFEAKSEPDASDAAQARIGLALAQWRYGALELALLDEVRADLAARRGIADYIDPARREKVVSTFVAKLAKPNPKPRLFPKPPKPPRRPRKPRLAAFEAGDCLALQLPSGVYRAALVLVRDQGLEGEEFNIIARLGWKGPQPPQAEVFLAPRPVSVAMYPWGPYGGSAPVSVVGRIEVSPTLFGIEKMPDYWSWQFVRPGRSASPMTWVQWEDLAGIQL